MVNTVDPEYGKAAEELFVGFEGRYARRYYKKFDA